jgi:ribosome-associated protein
LENKSLHDVIIDAVDDLKGEDICSLNVSELTSFTDEMLIVTGNSNRHVKAIANNVIIETKKANLTPFSTEGHTNGEWVLLDFGDLVLHVMLAETRQLYDLEKLWTPHLNKTEENA